MFNRRTLLASAAASLAVVVIAGCNYKGEEPTKEKDFAVSSAVNTAIGAAGSTFVHPIMTRWITTMSKRTPACRSITAQSAAAQA